MSLVDLIDLKKLDNIANNIKELDKEVETIVKNIVEKYNTKKQFIKLDRLQKMSDKFTTWDYKTSHGAINILSKLNLLIEICRIQDHEMMEQNKRMSELEMRIIRLELDRKEEGESVQNEN
tara:strand:+ start:2481 stop:2843 length:363 start_codon:yes stop_codon:yes gene_type:complete